MPRMSLIVEEGPLQGGRFHFETHDVFVFGRDEDCHGRIPDDGYISRHHFGVDIDPPNAYLRDLGSRNGTWVNGRRVGGKRAGATPSMSLEVRLAAGDEIRAGRTRMRLAVEGTDERAVTRFIAPGGPAAPAPGKFPRIPGYEISGEMGRGTYGITYLACRRSDGAEVALKVVSTEGELPGDARTRFSREAALLRHLSHPNIVAFVDAGTTPRLMYLAMECCRMGPVSRLAASHGGKLPLREAAQPMLGAIAGLAHAHGHGLVHRDVKPDNILLAPQGKGRTAKVGDFGFAKLFEQAGMSGVTISGIFGGTPGFMPREQVLQFRHVRPASDVWSAGAAFYNLLTGDLPRRGKQGDDALRIMLEGEVVPIRNRLRDLPPAIAEVIDRSLAPNPDDRYPDAGALHQALAAVL